MKHLKNSAFCSFCRAAIITSAILSFCTGNILHAQEAGSGNVKVYPSFGIAFGFFHPEDINELIEISMTNAGVIKQYGTTDLFMYYQVHGGVTFRMKRVDFSGELAYAVSPKFIFVENGDNMSFFFRRISPGVSANYYIPMKSEKMDFFFGGGFQYHFMKFEEIKGHTPGFSLRAGISMQFGKFNMQPNVSFLYARTDDTNLMENGIVMNYTSGLIGIIMSFHPPIDGN